MTSHASRAPLQRGALAVAVASLFPNATLSAFPGDKLGDEFRVNEYTEGDQVSPAVAHSGNGDFVVTWADNSEYHPGIYFRRYRANGVPRDAEPVRVDVPDDAIVGVPHSPDVAMDPDGDFVVAWLDFHYLYCGEDYCGPVLSRIQVRRFAPSGKPRDTAPKEVAQGNSEFTSLGSPSVAMDGVGNFVVAYDEVGFDAARFVDSCYGLYVSRFSANGKRLGTRPIGPDVCSFSPSVDMESDGDFVIAYEVAEYNPRSGDYLSARLVAARYEKSGAAIDLSPLVVAPAALYSDGGEIAVDNQGDFVVAWSSNDDGYPVTQSNVMVRRFQDNATLRSAPIQINTDTQGLHSDARVGVGADGSFTVVWQRETLDLDNKDIYKRTFNARGRALDPGDVRVNSFAIDDQKRASVSVNSDSSFVVAWESEGDRDGSGSGVYAQRHDGQASLPLVSFAAAGQQVGESAGTVGIRLRLSQPSTREVTVPLKFGGTAVEGQDYTPSTHAFVIPAGQTGASLRVRITNDGNTESNESLVVTMGQPSNADKATTGIQHRLIITDDD